MIYKTIIIGAGISGSEIGKQINSSKKHILKGYLDDNKKKLNQKINKAPVLGTIKDLEKIIKSKKINHIIICMPRAKASILKEIIKKTLNHKVNIQIIPKYYDILNQDTKFNYPIKDIDLVEMLGYSQIILTSKTKLSQITNKAVLITGAGGSIGSELSMLLASLKPSKLILIGRGENSIFKIKNKILKNYPQTNLKSIILNITNKAPLETIFKNYKPKIIFHAAAHKHVNFMEENIKEAFLNNVSGSLNLLNLSHKYKAEKIINISTDKAVNPISIMGLTKYITELLTTHYNKISKSLFATVRFGNVIGSKSSIIPIFKKQISEGGPLTITDKKAKRYFMSIAEATQLLLEASNIAKGGEIFILKMRGEILIYDIAKLLLKLHNNNSNQKIKIKYTGLKQGEKLSENLYDPKYPVKNSSHKNIIIASPITVKRKIIKEIEKNIKNINKIKEEKLKSWMFNLYPKN